MKEPIVYDLPDTATTVAEARLVNLARRAARRDPHAAVAIEAYDKRQKTKREAAAEKRRAARHREGHTVAAAMKRRREARDAQS